MCVYVQDRDRDKTWQPRTVSNTELGLAHVLCVFVCEKGIGDESLALNFKEAIWESGNVLLCQVWSRPQGLSVTAVELLPLACKVAVPGPLARSCEPSCHLALLGLTEHRAWPVSTTPSIPAGGQASENHRGQAGDSLS